MASLIIALVDKFVELWKSLLVYYIDIIDMVWYNGSVIKNNWKEIYEKFNENR